MEQIAFKVKPESDFYKLYFQSIAEKKKFMGYAKAFFEKNGFSKNGKYVFSETLRCELDRRDESVFQGQYKKEKDSRGFRIFKKTSPIQKKWLEEVVQNVDMKTVHAVDYWWFGCILHGSYSLWHREKEIYGLLESKSGHITTEKWMEPMKMSEYYSIVEKDSD